MHQTTRYRKLELQNNFLELSIDWIEDIALNWRNEFAFPENILNLIYEAPSAAAGFRGSIEDVAGQRRHELEAGDVILVPAGLRARHDCSEATRQISIHFSLAYGGNPDVLSALKYIPCFHDPGLVEKFRMQLNAPDQVLAMIEIRTAIMELCRRFYPENPEKSNSVRQQYCRLLAELAGTLNAATSVGDLAGVLHCRRETFSRNFKHDMGITPTAWLHQALARRIVHMLHEENIRFKEIAARLKFSSEFYLSRFFKSQTGLSPRDYRNLFRTGSETEDGDTTPETIPHPSN